MNRLSFAQPQFFWLLCLLPLLVLLKALADMRGRHALRRAAAPRLLPRLARTFGRWRGWTALGLELAALACFIATLARPQWGHTEEEITTSGRSLLFAVDTSRSMLANDLQPDRLTRTKLVIEDIIRKLSSDRIGLIAFAGRAFLQAPITEDHDALLETLDQIDTEIIPRGGTNLAEAIDLAVETFTGKRRGPGGEDQTAKSDEAASASAAAAVATSQALLIFSDGEELEGEALAAAKRAYDHRITIITIGAGTAKGGPIPDPERGGVDYIKDASGKIVTTRLQERQLEEIAKISRGLYVPLGEVIRDKRLELILSKLNASSNKNKIVKKAIDRYRWPLGAGMLLMLAALAVRIVPRALFSRWRQPLSGGVGAASQAASLPAIVLAMLALACAGQQRAAAEAAPAAKSDDVVKQLEEQAKAWAREHKPEKWEATLRGHRKSAPFAGDADWQAWNDLGAGTVEYAKGNFDAALAAFGKAVLGKGDAVQEQAYFNLGNTLYQRAALACAQAKEADAAFLTQLIGRLQDCLEQYNQTLALNSRHEEAAENKRIIEEMLKSLKQQQQQQQQQQNQGQPQEGQGEGQSESQDQQQGKGQNQKGKGDGEDGDQDQQQGDKQGEGGKGQRDDKSQKGESGDKPQDKDGKNGKENEKASDGRSEEQKRKESEANQASNEQRKGKIEAEKGAQAQQGKKPVQRGQPGDEETNPQTGFSRAEARRNLKQFADEVPVRPRIDTGMEERPFKNW